MIPTHIVVHHSLTQDSGTVSWSAIRRYHVQVNFWRDIGYHAGVELAGADFESLLGRPWDVVGAHTKEQGMNNVSLGVCLVGNFDLSPPTNEDLETVRDRVILPWMRLFKIPPQNIHPHRLYAPKTCPGTQFTGELMARFIPGIDLEKWKQHQGG